jgi:hypothetical protein
MHAFHELLAKEPKTPIEKLAIMAVIEATTDVVYQKLTPEQTWDALLLQHDRVFEKQKPGENKCTEPLPSTNSTSGE